jgi:hypothetical protein
MKPKMNKRRTAFTRTDLIVVIFILAALIGGMESVTSTESAKHKAQRIGCLNNLKQIGMAYSMWAEGHGGQTPASASVSLGGWSDLLTNADQGANGWTNYAILADALGNSPRLLMCRADDRQPAWDFLTNAMLLGFRDYYLQHSTYFLSNSNLAYFVGVSANAKSPRSVLAGDRNLGGGTAPAPDYGFSPESGNGNDVAIPVTGPVSWSLKMHSAGKTAGAGNILLGDGSAQQVSSGAFNHTWLPNATPTTNWPAGHVPATPSIRLVFP